MAGLYDDAGGYVDPLTGLVIASPQTNMAGPGLGDTTSALGSLLRQKLLPPGATPPPTPAALPAPAAAPPPGPMPGTPAVAGPDGAPMTADEAAQLAAMGIPTQSPQQTQAASAEGMPPGAAQAAAGTPPPAPFLPPGVNPPGYIGGPSQGPSGPPQGPTAAPPQAPPAQPQPAPSAPPQAPSSGPADYSSATPPPDPMKPIVDAAAAKYNVPQNVAYWMGSHESSWNPAAIGPQTSSGTAKGAWQFKDDTAKQYNLADPTDFASSTDAAMHKISDLAKQNGGDWTKAVQQYGTFSTGKGPELDAAAQAGFRTYLGQKSPPVTQTAQSDAPAPGGGQSVMSGGLPGAAPDYQLPYPDAAKSKSGNGLLALASGLLSGPNFSQGLGKGLAGYLGEQQQDRTAQMGANNEYVQLQNLGINNAYKNAMLGNATNRTGIQQQNADTGRGRLGVQQENAGTAQARLKVAQDALNGRLNPNTQAALSQGKKAGVDAETDINNVIGSQTQDTQGLADINNAQTLIAQKPELMGPTLANRWSRFAAENGLSGNAADLNALQKMTADQRNTALASLTNGHVGGIRSNAELNNLSQAVANVNTSPAAANFILNMQKTQIEGRQAWRQELTDRYQDDPDSITGRQYNVTKQKFFSDYFDQHKLPDYVSPSAGQSSGQQPSPQTPGSGAAPVKGVSNGVQWSFSPSTPQ